jgi:hypothetical protein
MHVNGQASVDGALILLRQIGEYPDVIRQALDEPDWHALLAALDTLAERAAAIGTDAELLEMADAVHQLVEGQAALRELLLPPGAADGQQALRTVTLADQRATTALSSYATQLAPQIRDAVTECRAQLQAALGKSAQGK